jgi:hypothetical protein
VAGAQCAELRIPHDDALKFIDITGCLHVIGAVVDIAGPVFVGCWLLCMLLR